MNKPTIKSEGMNQAMTENKMQDLGKEKNESVKEVNKTLTEKEVKEIIKKIEKGDIKEGEIVERNLMMPVEFLGHNKEERPTGNLFFDPENFDPEKKIPVYIEFPRFFEEVGRYS